MSNTSAYRKRDAEATAIELRDLVLASPRRGDALGHIARALMAAHALGVQEATRTLMEKLRNLPPQSGHPSDRSGSVS